MKILLCSNWFEPSIGGVETVSKILAEEFTKAGATVTVVTSTPGPASEGPYKVVRQPSSGEVRALAKQSDVVWQNLMSLNTLFPVLFTGKPIVMTHQSWLRHTDFTRTPKNRLKLIAMRVATNISISQAIADDLPIPTEVIGNPFEASVFEPLRDRPRERDIVFLGRLVSDKGCDVLLNALGMLRQQGLTPSLTVIGDGEEMENLKALAAKLGIAPQIEFSGSVNQGRGEIVARHRVMAVPSLWAEPFGIVALEGIASGCALVASERGGLIEAVGPCGLPFPNGDATALAGALKRVLYEPGLRESLVAKGPEHLKRFQPAYIAQRYLQIFERLIARR
jgi:glycogen(starch) synthase